MEDHHASAGPVSTLPGHRHRLPEGTSCDTHPDRPAVARIQGETDRFGCEYLMMCQGCYDSYQQFRLTEEQSLRRCERCGNLDTLSAVRDPEEGTYGPVYQMCGRCKRKMLTDFCQDD